MASKHYDMKTICQILKTAFRGYRSMNRKLRGILNRLGFRIVEGRKHYKIFFLNGTQSVPLSKTSSDVHTGLNFVQEVRASLIVPMYDGA